MSADQPQPVDGDDALQQLRCAWWVSRHGHVHRCMLSSGHLSDHACRCRFQWGLTCVGTSEDRGLLIDAAFEDFKGVLRDDSEFASMLQALAAAEAAQCATGLLLRVLSRGA